IVMFLLSRWSGSVVATVGARTLLMVGPSVAAVGFALFMRPGVGGSDWTTFFPAVLVLGVGVSIAGAPLTTPVINAVAEQHAGTASGINNAVSRMAGLVAVAGLGTLMLIAFGSSLMRGLEGLPVSSDVKTSLRSQTQKLAAIEIPPDLDRSTEQSIRAV